MLLALELIVGRRCVWLPQRWNRLDVGGGRRRGKFANSLLKQIRRFQRFSHLFALPVRSPRQRRRLRDRRARIYPWRILGAAVLRLGHVAFIGDRPRRARCSARGLLWLSLARNRRTGCFARIFPRKPRSSSSSSSCCCSAPRRPGARALLVLRESAAPAAACSRSAAVIARAAWMRARWLNACGKLPTCRRRSTSYSSASNPRSLLSPTTRSYRARASSRRPLSASAWAIQNEQATNCPRRQKGRRRSRPSSSEISDHRG